MLYYDYVLTLPREIEFLWPPHNKQGWFTLACFLNRYIPVIGLSPITASYFFPVTSTVRPSSLISKSPASENLDQITVVSYRGACPDDIKLILHTSCEGLHTYHEWFVMVVQTHAGSMSHKHSNPFP